MEKKYNVYDITVTPYVLVPETIDFTIDECIEWISINGDAVTYTIIEYTTIKH
jgi:hypothetical protein